MYKDKNVEEALAELKFSLANKLGRPATTAELFREAISHAKRAAMRVVK